jgi:nuclear pore complex protein Nup107
LTPQGDVRERLNEESHAPSTSKNPYTPPLTVVQSLIEGNKDLIELSVRPYLHHCRTLAIEIARVQAIRDWLHSIPTSLNPAEIRRGYLTYSKNKLKQAKRTGQPLPRGLVEELDPDAVWRSSTGRLDEDDAVRFASLLLAADE